jgi:ABC-2 type transport system permease protein
MRIIDITLKDLLQIVRDWKAAFFLLVMPIFFTLVFGFAFGGSTTEDEDPRISVGFINHDNDRMGQVLYDLINVSEVIRPDLLEEEPALESLFSMVERDEIAAVVILPEGYSESLVSGENPMLRLILKPDTAAGAAIQNSLSATLSRLRYSFTAAEFSAQIASQYFNFNDEETRKNTFDSSFIMAVDLWQDPPIKITATHSGNHEKIGVEETENAFTHSSPGMMVQFALAGLISAAEILVLERKSGSLRRLLTTTTSRVEIILGHLFAMFLLILSQFTILISFAQFFLGVNYFSAPLATLVITITTTLFAASMGLLIGILAKTPELVIIFSLIPMFILSGLGGAWVPLEFTNETFQTIGHFTPLAWAMDGFQNIIIRGMGIESVWIPALVLLGFASVCISLAFWRFKLE